MYGEEETKNKIYSYTPEVGANFDGFWPDPSRIDRLNKESMHQNLSLAAMTLNHGVVSVNYDKVAEPGKGGKIAMTLKKLGFLEGEITVSVRPIEASIFTPFSEVFSLNQLETANREIDYQLPEGGEEFFRFEVSVDNGEIIKRDTFEIESFFGGTGLVQSIFEDSLNNGDAFDIQWTWNTTQEDFVSAPTSMTDSPFGFYNRFANEVVEVKEPFYLFDALETVMSYKAKWEIEPDYDYVQVQGSIDGINWVSLCGQFTEEGVGSQPSEPLYDGVQIDWVSESVSLNEFNGSTAVWIRFILLSDGGLEMDGFYFDDIKVEIRKTVTGIIEEHVHADLKVFPNPVLSVLSYSLDSKALLPSQGVVYNLNNQIVHTLNQSEIDAKQVQIHHLPVGSYFLKLNKEHKYAVVPFVKR